jgi:MarR family transcriptional regulator, organic hydroperoxide resistance regulator
MTSARESVKNRQQERRRAAQMMKRILIHFRGQMDEQLRAHGVTTAQLQVMKIIQTEPGASGAQLARSCHVTPQSAQALLKQLEEDGWIRRVKDRVNDRILVSELTVSGAKLLRAAEKAAKVIEARLWRGVPEGSVDTLNTVLEQCLANLEPVDHL